MKLEDLSDLLDAPKLTIRFEKYDAEFEVESVDGETWLRLQAFAAQLDSNDPEALKMSGLDLARISLGAAFDDVVKALPGREIERAGMTAFYWQIGNDQLANAYWLASGKAQATEPSPTPDTGTESTTPPTTLTDAEITTPQPAYGSGVKSPKKPAKPKKA